MVVDPLWGDPGAAAIEALNFGGRLVQVGESAGARASIASAAVRGRGVSILGHTNFLVPDEVRHAAYQRMVGHAAAGDLTVPVERVPLERLPDAWQRQAQSPGHKLVIVP